MREKQEEAQTHGSAAMQTIGRGGGGGRERERERRERERERERERVTDRHADH